MESFHIGKNVAEEELRNSLEETRVNFQVDTAEIWGWKDRICLLEIGS